MSLDVIVVNFHSARLIRRTLEIARNFGGETVGIILVDNSPSDGGAAVARAAEPNAAIITNTVNRGYAAAVNQGIAHATADIVLLLNPDIRRISGNRTEVVDAFREPSIAAVVPRLLNTDGTLQPSCRRTPRPFDLVSEDIALAHRFSRWQRPRRYRMLDWDYRGSRRVDAATGACLFLRRAAVADVGLFDERFFVYYEETDWMIRAKARGWGTLYLPSVEAVHVSEGSSPGIQSQASVLLLESQYRYARKHFGPLTTTLIRATLLGIDTVRLAKYSLVGRAGPRAVTLSRIRVHLATRPPHPT